MEKGGERGGRILLLHLKSYLLKNLPLCLCLCKFLLQLLDVSLQFLHSPLLFLQVYCQRPTLGAYLWRMGIEVNSTMGSGLKDLIPISTLAFNIPSPPLPSPPFSQHPSLFTLLFLSPPHSHLSSLLPTIVFLFENSPLLRVLLHLSNSCC